MEPPTAPPDVSLEANPEGEDFGGFTTEEWDPPGAEGASLWEEEDLGGLPSEERGVSLDVEGTGAFPWGHCEDAIPGVFCEEHDSSSCSESTVTNDMSRAFGVSEETVSNLSKWSFDESLAVIFKDFDACFSV